MNLLDAVEHDDAVRVIVLTGKVDSSRQVQILKNLQMFNQAKNFQNLLQSGQAVFERLETFSKPVIAAIHGAALGGGLELAMGCHIRFVTENAKLGLPELQLGINSRICRNAAIPRYVGVAKAAEMLFTSEPISGEEAVQCGISQS